MNDQLFHNSVHMAGAAILQLKPTDMEKPTPCSEWNVHELANHLLNEVAWVKPLLEGKTIAEVGSSLDGDLLGSDPADSWHKYCKEATDSVMATSPHAIAHLSYADKPAIDYVREVGADVLVHGWDLAKAIGMEYRIDDATAEDALKATEDIRPGARSAGLINNALPVPENASATDKLLAEFGRRSDWRA
jgi:uncharacterized protein (TIGR03086 family)